jgi:hypothetical protein
MTPIREIDETYDRMEKSDVKYRFVIDNASLCGPCVPANPASSGWLCQQQRWEHDMKNPGDLEYPGASGCSEQPLSVAVLAVPAVAALHRRVARDRPGAVTQ